MKRQDITTLFKLALEYAEADIDAMEPSADKKTAQKHMSAAHAHLLIVGKLAEGRGDISPNSVGGDKPPKP